MKAKSYYLKRPDILDKLIRDLKEIILDGSKKVTISDAGSKSSKQRGLQWELYTDVAKSGIGGRHEDMPDGVDLVCKFHIAIPIMQRDDDLFRDLYTMFKRRYEGDEDYADRLIHFLRRVVHTEDFTTSQMAEYLTGIYNRYGPMGVNLTLPEFKGLTD